MNSSGGIDAEIAFGILFGFDDVDRDGSWHLDPTGYNILPDKFIGLANTAVIYMKTAPAPASEFIQKHVSSTYSGALFASADGLTSGYHLAQLVCGTGGVPVGKSHYQIVGNDTTLNMVLFPASDTSPKNPQPPDCLIVF
jgi:hypothetical protein